MKNYSLIKRAKKKKIISITRVVDKVQKKLKDYGNLVGGCKPLLDALKTSGFIVDDSEKWIKDTYKQLVTSENATYVDIRDEGYLWLL